MLLSLLLATLLLSGILVGLFFLFPSFRALFTEGIGQGDPEHQGGGGNMTDAEESPFRMNSPSSWEGFLVTFVINAVVFALVFTSFLFLRRTFLFSPRRSEGELPKGLLSWIPALLGTPKEEILRRSGLDGYMVVYMGRCCFIFFSTLTVASLIVLAPLYATAGGGLTGLDVISFSNVPLQHPRAWATFVFTYLFSIAGYILLDRVFAEYVRTKHEFTKNNLGVRHYSILLRRLPHSLRSDAHLGTYFSQLFGPVVQQAHVPNGNKKLHSLVARREAVLMSLENATWKAQHTDKPVTHRTGFLGLWGKRVDSLEYYTEQLKELNEQVEAEQQVRRQPTDTGIVMFSNVTDQALASRVDYSVKSFHGLARIAPQPRDILWQNLEASHAGRIVGRIISLLLSAALLFFWTIPVVFLSSLTTLENLNRVLPFLESVTNRGVLKGFLEGFLPTLGLVIFMALLPLIMRAMADLHKPVSQSDRDIWVVRRLYVFYFYNIFLVVTISGTIFTAVDAIARNPGFIVDGLAMGLPSVALYYAQFIMINAVVTLPIALLRQIVNPIIQYFVYRAAKTDKAKKKAMFCGNYPYDLRYPKMMIIFLLALVYSTIFPLITAFGTLYFFMFWLCESYEVMHMRNLPYESESKVFPTVHNRGVVALFVFQLTMAGMFGINQNVEAGALTAPLLLITIGYGIYSSRKYAERAKHFSLEYALGLDALPRPAFGGEDHDYFDPVEDSARVEPSIVHPDGHVEERRMPKRVFTTRELAARQDKFYTKYNAGTVHKLKGTVKKLAAPRVVTGIDARGERYQYQIPPPPPPPPQPSPAGEEGTALAQVGAAGDPALPASPPSPPGDGTQERPPYSSAEP